MDPKMVEKMNGAHCMYCESVEAAFTPLPVDGLYYLLADAKVPEDDIEQLLNIDAPRDVA